MLTPSFRAASVLALGLGAGPAFVENWSRRDADARFAQLDADGDGFVTRADVSRVSGAAKRFGKFDANRDGKLDRPEFAALIATLN